MLPDIKLYSKNDFVINLGYTVAKYGNFYEFM